MSKEISTKSEMSKQERDDFFKARKEAIAKAIKGKGMTSMKVAKYIPDGYHGHITCGEARIEQNLALGYTFATNEKGEKVSIPGPSLQYLMIISLEEKAIINEINKQERLKYQNQTAIHGLSNVMDSASNTQVFREI